MKEPHYVLHLLDAGIAIESLRVAAKFYSFSSCLCSFAGNSDLDKWLLQENGYDGISLISLGIGYDASNTDDNNKI